MSPTTPEPARASQPQRQPKQSQVERSDPAAADRSPSFWMRHRRVLTSAIGALVAIAFFYYVVPRLVGLGPTLKLLRRGDFWWLALGVVFEAISLFGGIVLFRGVYGRPDNRIGWRASYLITMAGTATTKIVATAGAGGIALTVWALHGYGLSGADVASGIVCYELLTYAVYMGAIAVVGYGLWLGVFSGPAPVALTLVPAVMATAVILIVLSMQLVNGPSERFLKRRAQRSSGRAAGWWRRAAALPRTIRTGLARAIDMVKRRDRAVLGALAVWGFDIAVLWASFRAFGPSPPGAVIVMCYYLGTLGNALPLPGGIGGVEAGMIGAFLAFGVSSHLAVLAVLAYRTISYWLPTIPGAIAYWRLVREFRQSPSSGNSSDKSPTTSGDGSPSTPMD